MAVFFYWDTFFINKGLLIQKREDLALNNTDNLIYLAENRGYIPNGNLTPLMNRSQPPFLAAAVNDLFRITGDRKWLEKALAAMEKEHCFWTGKRDAAYGLNRYFHQADSGEAEDFYVKVIEPRLGISCPEGEDPGIWTGHYLAEAESGWDFTPRFSGRCADFIPVDLNSLLYILEDRVSVFRRMLGFPFWENWRKLAEKRKKRIQTLLWNESLGCFCDYDMQSGQVSQKITAAAFFPLWAGAANNEQARRTALAGRQLTGPGGLAACIRENGERKYQWDDPNVWPPLQYVAAAGMNRYGMHREAERIATGFLKRVALGFCKTGKLWEKYGVRGAWNRVNNEYPMPSMLGWTAGVTLALDGMMQGKKD
jgi:alpha,alpha-trehalase